MIPTSDQLETFQERIAEINQHLRHLKGAEVRDIKLIGEIKAICRDWLRFSESLKTVGALRPEDLDVIDANLKDIFQSTSLRTRSSAYQKKLVPVLNSFSEKVVIPVIRYEGSPAQVASRQLANEFSGKVTAEEQTYIEEAARCLAAKCNRAAIILLWAAGISRLHTAIEKIGFIAYNVALDQCLQKKGNPYSRASKTYIQSLPELQRCRDFDLLVVGMELWKYDLQVFEELDRLLGVRNGAAHPGMLKPSALDVQQYASKLSSYIFTVVPA